ncbi:Putative L-lactate dehydrogenase operon regulatory protein [Roseomonas mucosa]|uniref:Pyruvate dehydrogenase complex repressor n=1 Tax=Roseomonas mucosa TaxID=207340 RepID=A0A1S8D308_9PROT|nr:MULTISPECIES: FCD domain-containing protein [Roseomonas]MBS5904554.1 FCD domain-containing protein [Acetobacteraceae bacterium]ATR21632.1 transcriptional regulator LldR [Roseomonas sp. FDAARGOS_362]MCG7350606.1 FCD domain-containing protein [Roseomonas mucosa]MCG7358741.1 FCD domain-containing protein [Roseomonas mucosa]MDT8275242.1 FCD domain-containing protein [Roseomonas mucosa]
MEQDATSPAEGGRLASQLATVLRKRMLAGDFGIGDRLPAERALAGEFGVSRSSVREAIQMLASQGLLSSRQGGGTFVRALPGGGEGTRGDNWGRQAIVEPLEQLFRDNPDYRYDVLEIRLALEGAAAAHAARRATEEDRSRLRGRFEATLRDDEAATPAVLAQVDAAFHLAIAEASHNLVLQQIIRGMFDLLAASTSQSLEKLYLVPRVSEALAEQHRLLMQAVLGGDPDRARAASDAHIDFVRLTLKAIDEDEARLARSNPPRSLLSGRTGGPDRKTDP